MTKNQESRLLEWIYYHYNLGVNKFIIFLDNCTDNSKETLSSLTDVDIDVYLTSEIGYKSQNWISRSHEMYDFTLKNYNEFDWICFIEVDEFIFPQKKLDFKTYLKSLNTECLYINSWDFRGPFDELKPILQQSNLGWTDEQRFNSIYRYRGKSIIKPKYFNHCMDAHHFARKDGSVSNEFKIPHINYIQINYGKEVTIDDTCFKIYHFRNHTPSDMTDCKVYNF
jgi:hypothetical protein